MIDNVKKNTLLKADKVNQIIDGVNYSDNITAFPPLNITDTAAGKNLFFDDGRLIAVICDGPGISSSSSSSSSAAPDGAGYYWKEVQAGEAGDDHVKLGGKRDWKLFVWGNTMPLTKGQIVEIRPAGNGEYRCFWPGPNFFPISCDDPPEPSSSSSTSSSSSSSTSSEGSGSSESSNSNSSSSGPITDCSINQSISVPGLNVCVDGCVTNYGLILDFGFPIKMCLTTEQTVCP